MWYIFCLILFYGFWVPDSAPWFWTTYSNLFMGCSDNSEEEKMCLWLFFSVWLIKKATKWMQCHNSLRSWRYCLGARLKVWRRSRDPKKVVGTRRLKYRGISISRGSRLLWRLRRQISLGYYTIPPATQTNTTILVCTKSIWTLNGSCVHLPNWLVCMGMLHLDMVVAYNTTRTVSKTRSLMQLVFPRDTKWLVLLFSGFLPWLERQEYDGLSIRHHSPSGNPGLEINESYTVEGKRSDRN